MPLCEKEIVTQSVVPDIYEESKSILAAEALRSGSLLRLQVTGSSMLPGLWPGDLLIIATRSFEDLEAGEIALFSREERLYVHRVVRKLEQNGCRSLITRGDAMQRDDPPVRARDLLGCVVEIHRGDALIAPRRLSLLQRALAKMFCYSDVARSCALRLQSRTLKYAKWKPSAERA